MDYVPATPPKQNATVIDCTFVKACLQGFGGSPLQWKQIKLDYVERLSATESLIDCNNILWDQDQGF